MSTTIRKIKLINYKRFRDYTIEPKQRINILAGDNASYMLKQGFSMKEVSDWLGHSDISTSMNVYAHLDLETKKDVAERFKNIFPLKVLPEVLPASEE